MGCTDRMIRILSSVIVVVVGGMDCELQFGCGVRVNPNPNPTIILVGETQNSPAG